MNFLVSPRLVVGVVLGAGVLVSSGCSTGDPTPPPAVGPTVSTSPVPSAEATGEATAPTPSASQVESSVDARVIDHANNRYLVVTLPLDEWDVRVDWNPEDEGTMLRDVVAQDSTVAVATNGGIFTDQLVPGGLLVSDGEEQVSLNLNDGGGNFHLMPNGVFAVMVDGTAAVVNSVDYEPTGVEFATQSGPALLLDGEVHPEFNEGSTNVAFRSGVGVSPGGDTVYLAMSWSLTNFHDFATLFRDELGVDDALYLDGDISRLWVDQMEEPGPLAGPYAGVITARLHDKLKS
ncbi:phosphodiester glycosidase family protein [Demequina aurantiaca]|uniref:phosphodiester glycosidase family protein n=1 Tax=Demequina aurantiaca TaxID=676200 RepID=UPI0007862088|nr:phosphodiester glycosidase family protein [Demequina aurantiaca]